MICPHCHQHTVSFKDAQDEYGTTAVIVLDTIERNKLTLKQVIDTVEERVIQMALDEFKGNKTQAARLLNINRTTLVEKLKARQNEKNNIVNYDADRLRDDDDSGNS
jgi:DNA-binding NtrC family response regulator